MRHGIPVPPMVLPDTREGRLYAQAEAYPAGADVYFCGHFALDESPVFTDADLTRLRAFEVCANRRHDGERNLLWCCRCMAGYPGLYLDDQDKEGNRDRVLPM